MKMTRLVAVAITVAALGAGAARAQITEAQPAEFPPASYKGKQYVDSKGCVFIRAGIDGNVSWVSRVTRKRKAVCGFKPTSGAQVASAPAAPAPKVEQITIDTPAAAPAVAPKPVRVAAAKPRPAVVRQTAPKPVRRVIRKPAVQKTVQAVPVSVPVAVATATGPVPARVPARKVAPTRQVATACPGASPLSQQYLRGNGRSAVRCGPQTVPVVGGYYATQAAAPVTAAPVVSSVVAPQAPATAAPTAPAASVKRRVVSAPRSNAGLFAGLFQRKPKAPAVATPLTNTVKDHTRIVPRHVAINRVNTTNVKVPHGYRRVWDDGRLNPKRAEQSLSGRGHMLLVWTNTVPRRLINQATGRDVTASVPLVYPYVDVATQTQELGEVSIVRRDGQLVKRILRHRHAVSRIRAEPQPVISSRSAPKPQTAASAPRKIKQRAGKAANGGIGYVQIGLFTTDAKARKAAQHLSGMGMGARIGKVRHKGKSYLTVQAGPFHGSSATQGAVSRLRSVGYSGARVR